MIASGTFVDSGALWGAIALAVVGVAGAIRQLVRYLKQDGVREATLDALPKQIKGLEHELAAIREATSSNGGNSDQVGDIAKRVEQKLSEMQSTMDQQIGDNAAEHRSFERRIEGHSRQLRELAKEA